MSNLIYIIVPAVAVLAVFALVIMLLTRKQSGSNTKDKGKKGKKKDRATILKEANKRLAQNPKDTSALSALGELYFNDDDFDKAYKTFELLIDSCATNPNLDEFDITMKYALSALKVGHEDEAYKSFIVARSLRNDVFEVNYNLGYLEFQRKNYEKAAGLLNQARTSRSDHIPTLRYLGHSLFRMQRYKEANAILRKVIELEPEDKESLFYMAQCYHNTNQSEQAVKIFTHLRPDPVLGPSSALYAGTIHLNARQFQKAMMDFEIGLRHKNIPTETLLELKYRLSTAYVKNQEIGSALKLLKEIRDISPEYKDIKEQISRFSELNANQNLQVFLLAPTSDFVNLCRKLTTNAYSRAKVKIIDISVQKAEYADILAEVSTRKFEDMVLFRYIRTTGAVSDILLRDLYGKIKEVRADRGYCLTAGQFTEGAKKFVEARLIDLVEKDDLLKKLNSIQSKVSF